MSSSSQYLRARDIADLLGLSIRTIRRWLADGTLPSVRIGGARLVLERHLLMLLKRPNVREYDEAQAEESAHQIKQFSDLVKAQSK